MPGRSAARAAVHLAVREGRLPRVHTLACAECGGQARAYHHHEGYDAAHQLDVVALCVLCHRKAHAAWMSTPWAIRELQRPLHPLYDLRQARRLSVRALAALAGVNGHTIRNIEAGGHRPQNATIRKLAAALGVRVEALTRCAPVEG